MTNQERRFKVIEIEKYYQITKNSEKRALIHSSLIALWLSLFAINNKAMISTPTFLGYVNTILCTGLVGIDLFKVVINITKKIGYEKEMQILLDELGFNSIENLNQETGGRTR